MILGIQLRKNAPRHLEGGFQMGDPICYDSLYMVTPNREKISNSDDFLDLYGNIYDYLNQDLELENDIEEILSEGLNGEDAEKVGKVLTWKANGKYCPKEQKVTLRYSNNGISVSAVQEAIIKNFGKPDEEVLEGMLRDCADNNCIKHVGVVRTITLVYFMTQGRCPIYDRFANIGLFVLTHGGDSDFGGKLQTELEGKTLDELSKSDRIMRYNAYKSRIEDVYDFFGIDSHRASDLRRADKALWVYGHLFGEKRE